MSSSWWAKKLGGGGQPAGPTPHQPSPPPSGYYPPQPQQQPYPQQQPPPSQEQEQEGEGLHRGDPRSWSRASKAAKEETTTCPECGSGNYFSATYAKKGSNKSHCFDCGYPLMQSGSGLPSDAGDATNVPYVGTHAAENVAAQRYQQNTAQERAAERQQLKQQGKSDLLGPLG